MGIHLIETDTKPDHGVVFSQTPFYLAAEITNQESAEKAWYAMQEHVHAYVKQNPIHLMELGALHDECIFIDKKEDAILAILLHQMAESAHEFIQEQMKELADKPNNKPVFQHLGSIQ